MCGRTSILDRLPRSLKNDPDPEPWRHQPGEGCAPYYDPFNEGEACCKRAKEAMETLKMLRDEACDINYADLSDEEIFQSVYKRYNKAFGGHLSGAFYGGLGVYLRLGKTEWKSIDLWSQMIAEIYAQLSLPDRIDMDRCGMVRLVELESYALYDRMCIGERRARIISRYPMTHTTLEYCCYLRDMSVAGLMPKEAASALASHACKQMYYKAEAALGIPTEDSFAQVLDYASELMETEQLDVEVRFSQFLQSFPHWLDQTNWRDYLTEFLGFVGKKWPEDHKAK